MADDKGQDKTEQPTAKRQEEAIEKGNVAKSTELNSVGVLIGAMIAFKFTSEGFSTIIRNFTVHTYKESSFMDLSVSTFPSQVSDFMSVMASVVAPVIILILLFGLAINYAQVGVVFAKKALKPELKKINPINGIKRMFSSRSLVELAKGILKIIILASISYSVLTKYKNEYMLLTTLTASEIIAFFVDIFFELTIKVAIALLIMAIGDFAYQKYKHQKDLKMTKQEVKDEMKQQEGDPQIRGRMRGEMRKVHAHRMMQAIPEATVVVTNPTHFAIAIKYDPLDKSDAPKIVAKGKMKLAEKIKQIARENGIPVVEDKPLARGLFDAVEVGMEIPYVFYQAVAEILSKIYLADKKRLPVNGGMNG